MLAGQGIPFRARIPAAQQESCTRLLELLARMGAAGRLEAGNEVIFDRGDGMKGASHPETDLEAPEKLALLIAGLYGKGATEVREPLSSRDRVAELLERRRRRNFTEPAGGRARDDRGGGNAPAGSSGLRAG